MGDLKITIFEQQPRVQASVDLTLLFGESSVLVKAELKTESDIRLRETYESAEVMVGGFANLPSSILRVEPRKPLHQMTDFFILPVSISYLPLL